MSRFSPGPWMWVDSEDEPDEELLHDRDGNEVIEGGGRYFIEAPDARLIAAAPEMCELLADMPTPSQGTPPPEWYRRRAALLALIAGGVEP